MYRMSNAFPYSIDKSFLTAGPTILFSDAAVRALAAQKPVPSQQTTSWYPVGSNVLLRNMGKKIYVFGTNRMKTHEFRSVQLIRGAGTEGVGITEIGYVCVWAASGAAPISF